LTKFTDDQPHVSGALNVARMLANSTYRYFEKIIHPKSILWFCNV